MGSQRRILEQLTAVGVSEAQREPALRAIEKLECAGDNLSDAVYPWLSGEVSSEQMMGDVTRVIAELLVAARVLEQTESRTPRPARSQN